MRIILHGFGSFPIFFWHLIAHAREQSASIEWAIILPTDHHELKFQQLLGKDRVLVLDTGLEGSAPDNHPYPGSLFGDLEAEKRTYKNCNARQQTERGMRIFAQNLAFMQQFAPTHALVSQVEGFDGKAFIAAARQVKARVIVPTGCRNLGGGFFSDDDKESLPAYAFNNPGKFQKQAAELLTLFSNRSVPAHQSIHLEGKVLPCFTPPLFSRIAGTLRRWASGKGNFQWDFLRASFLNNVPWLRDKIWQVRTWKNRRYCSINNLEELPPKYVFYPLQYSPESSINTPAPYFLDQLRAIDAIRFALPSNYRLVVKEHPACILIRPGSFCRRLLRSAGVEVARVDLSTREILLRADLTISVTGTATFEAFLLGRPALCLGPTFFSSFLGGAIPLEQLSARMREVLGRNVPEEDRIHALSCILNARYEHNFGSPGTPGEPVLRDTNIAAFFQNLLNHCQRLQPLETETAK